MQLTKLIIRGVQIAMVAVVIGLSASLVKGQVTGDAPSITTWSLVTGIWGAIAALAGFAALYFEQLQGLIMVVIDGLATFFFASSSIAMAVKLGVGACSGNFPDGWTDDLPDNVMPPNPYCAEHGIIAGGSIIGDPRVEKWRFTRPGDWYVSRCHMAQALVAFMFFALAASGVAAAFSVIAWRRAGRKLTAY